MKYLYIDENREGNTVKDHIENYESYLEDMVLEVERTKKVLLDVDGDFIVVGSENFGPEILYDMVLLLTKRINGEPWVNKRP